MDMSKVGCNLSESAQISLSNNQVKDSDTSWQKRKVTADDTNSISVLGINVASTSTIDIYNKQMRVYEAMSEKIPWFVNRLHHTCFEDGMRNPSIDFVEQLYKYNPFVTNTWLYAVYASNMRDERVIEGLLRIVAFLELPQSLVSSLIPLVRLGLLDNSLNCQEAAIMLCETWRTKECLDVLMQADLQDSFLKRYADELTEELKVELHFDVA